MKFDYSEMTEEHFSENESWLWWKVQRFDELPFKPWNRDKTEKDYLQRITNEGFWVLPKSKKMIPVDDYGSFEISTHVFLNESLQLLVNDPEKINCEIDDLTFKSLKKLKMESKELQESIESINNDVRTYLESCRVYFIDSLNGSDIDTLSDSVQEAQTAFYGAAFGNLFAIRKLIPKYNIKSQWIEKQISILADLNKKSLLHKIAISDYPKQSEKRWEFLKPIFNDLENINHINDERVKEIFKSYDDRFNHKPPKGYFTQSGKPKDKQFAEAFKKIYENKFPDESVSTKRIKQVFDFSVLHQFE